MVLSFHHPENSDIVKTKQKVPHFRNSRLLIHDVIFQPGESMHFTKGYISREQWVMTAFVVFLYSQRKKIYIFVHHECT